jgi:putative transposase
VRSTQPWGGAAETPVVPRTARLVVPGSPHAIELIGGPHRLWATDVDRQRFADALTACVPRDGCSLHQATIGPGAVHLVLTPPDEAALTRTVRGVCTYYARARRAAGVLHSDLFAGRFHSSPITDEPTLIATTLAADSRAYVHRRAAAALRDPWSTASLHAAAPSRLTPFPWTPARWYLELGGTATERAERYRALQRNYLRRRSY